ncbi:MAG: NADH-quinone oxidoreductase subunit J [Pseudomonas fluorescens]|nr:MAG: NADH-quinone oxidoreductase subunit J [Pseudomonas fluorescens]
MLPDLLFLLFSAGILGGAGLIIGARNPMTGMLGMLMTFLNAAGLFVLFGAEFLGLLLIMVYLGAIAVMFLFVLMTIDIEFFKTREGFASYLPFGLIIVALLAAEFIFAANFGLFSTNITVLPAQEQAENIVQIGNVLFTTYALPFQLAGLVLLTAMIGAIVLTHRPRSGVKRQDIAKQVFRTKEEGLTITKPKLGHGTGTNIARHWNPKTVSKKVKSEE